MKDRFRSLMGALVVGAGSIWIAAVVIAAQQQAGAAVAVDNDDLGGVVTSAKGPEAGVWVIAETTELPTRFAKIVVTDDRGRYLIPRSPEGELQRVGPRLRPRRFGEGEGGARQDSRPEGGRRTECEGGRADLPRGLLDVAPQRAGQERVSRQRRHRRRHVDQEPGSLPRPDENRRHLRKLHDLSPAG